MCLGWSFMSFDDHQQTSGKSNLSEWRNVLYIRQAFRSFLSGGMRFLQILMNTWIVAYYHFTLVCKSVMFLKNMGIYLQIVSLIDMWNDRRHLVLSMFRQLLDPCAHRHGVNRSTPSKFNTDAEKRMVGRLLSFWDGKIFRGYIKDLECMIKAPKSIYCPWGLKDVALVDPLHFPGAFAVERLHGFGRI